MPGSPHRLLRRAPHLPVILLALVAVLLEATLWRWLTALGRALSHLPVFAVLERVVARLSPRMVVVAFVLPFLAFIPLLKLGELWLFLHGHVVLGVLVLLATKVVGVAFSARLFAIARPKMLQVRSFAWAYGKAMRLLDYGHALLERIPAWVATRDFLHRMGAMGRALLAAGWRLLRAGMGHGARHGFRLRLAAAMRMLRR
ncbi:hypothetical protein [Belnapia rosea]|uniref:hypothetical protein n=1 Tax=Belnapia rosea TaxID=938405 RepID=UPI0008898A6E|nr:hypothetical protein [Belnapia rosea]SDB72510.1 hypothetical protein SAMN02927895_04465 [Belnapia rosea]